MGATQPVITYGLAEYLAFEEGREEKHEYWGGHIFQMAGASPEHNQICFNVTGIFARQISPGTCRGYSSDQKIWIAAAEMSTYADMTVVCGEPRYHAEHATLLLNPKVIIEVLSPSTESYDRGEKWGCYRQLASLTDYLLISQRRPLIEHYTRDERAPSWRYVSESDLQGVLEIDSIGCRLALMEVYSGIVFPPARPPRAAIEIVPGADGKIDE